MMDFGNRRYERSFVLQEEMMVLQGMRMNFGVEDEG